jgi:hypothetical protein
MRDGTCGAGLSGQGRRPSCPPWRIGPCTGPGRRSPCYSPRQTAAPGVIPLIGSTNHRIRGHGWQSLSVERAKPLGSHPVRRSAKGSSCAWNRVGSLHLENTPRSGERVARAADRKPVRVRTRRCRAGFDGSRSSHSVWACSNSAGIPGGGLCQSTQVSDGEPV